MRTQVLPSRTARRTPVRCCAAALTAVTLAATAACGGSDSGGRADAQSARPSTSASPTPSPTPAGPLKPAAALRRCPGLERATWSRDAGREFGRANLRAAFCEMFRLTVSAYGPLMKHDTHFEASQFDYVKPYLTPRLNRRWDRDVARFVATNDEKIRGDGGKKDRVRGLVWADIGPDRDARGVFDWNPPGRPVTSEFTILDGGLTPKALLFQTKDKKVTRLVLPIGVTGEVAMSGPGNKKYENDAYREIIYVLVKNNDADKPWLVQDYSHFETLTGVAQVARPAPKT